MRQVLSEKVLLDLQARQVLQVQLVLLAQRVPRVLLEQRVQLVQLELREMLVQLDQLARLDHSLGLLLEHMTMVQTTTMAMQFHIVAAFTTAQGIQTILDIHQLQAR